MVQYEADSCTSPPKEGVLRIFVVLKNPSLSAAFEPENLLSIGNRANRYATEDEKTVVSNLCE
jgi:hypothetical protein